MGKHKASWGGACEGETRALWGGYWLQCDKCHNVFVNPDRPISDAPIIVPGRPPHVFHVKQVVARD